MRYISSAVLLALASISPLTTQAYTLADESRIEKAMRFLYDWMPLPDSINYPESFFRDNVKVTLQARAEMPWGDSVPDREWRHFVLPLRVNNEDLDNSRAVFYEELRDRVKGMPMRDAILEVNHWCHEKVTYQPSDARTSSPLSAISQAIGRCGEESTFTVAALRAVGIPARQVYTPRWAHTDDNHAWVEAWADGRWWFLGACEPEPILNLAWFNAPASRGMLMNTKVFGHYDGPEEQLDRNAVTTVINVTPNYAPTSVTTVRVTDASGKPVEGAYVAFSLYNYAEYYPVATRNSDSNGLASLTSGLGDMIVWASDGNNFGLAKVCASAPQPVTVVLDKDSSFEGKIDFDITPPQPSASLPKPSPEQAARNENRKAHEDSLRNAYTSTFITADEARNWAAEMGLDPEKTSRILAESRGNHKAIKRLIENLDPGMRLKAMTLLGAISEKDRRDIPMEVITDRLAISHVDSPLYADYILNPRVEYEGLTPFVVPFLQDMQPEDVTRYNTHPALWAEWVSHNIATDVSRNPSQLRAHPLAVWRHRVADALSRDIFFVASARAMGIAARRDQVTGKVQWHDGNKWIDVKLDNRENAQAHVTLSGVAEFSFTPLRHIDDPVYYSHFTISKIENGKPRLLDYNENMTLSSIASGGCSLDAGQYVLTTGQRMADGSVMARSRFFNVTDGKAVTVPLELRQDERGLQVIGNFNSELKYTPADGEAKSLLSTTGRGYYTLIYGKPNHEPTAHVLNDISAIAPELEKDGRRIMLIYGDDDQLRRAALERFGSLPSTVSAGADIDGQIISQLTSSLHLTPGDAPVVVVADTFNRVVFASQGYTIGMGHQLLDILSRLE